MQITRALQSAGNRLSPWWSMNFFGEGFWWSYGICRVFLAVALLLVFRDVDRDYRVFIAAQNPENYHPLGLLYLFGRGVPDPELLNAFREVLRVSLGLLLVGFFSRLNLLICTTLLCCLCGMNWAFSAGGWCHGWNPVLLPAIALLFGPPSPLSVDAALRKLLRTPLLLEQTWRSRSSVLLGQFAVAMIFASAALYKIVLAHGEPFAWCYSDNMRNTLLLQYWVLAEDMPSWISFAVSHPWAYKGMAVGNILSQLMPILACIFFRRPLIRLLAGCAFLLEGIGIYAVMGLWNPYWFPLAGFFIDWDGLIRWLGRIPKAELGSCRRLEISAASTPARLRWAFRTQTLWALLFAGVYLYPALFHPRQQRFTYPFTAFPMYSDIIAVKPYWEHRPYHLFGSEWDIQAEPPVRRAEFVGIWREWYSAIWWHPDPHEIAMTVKKRLESAGHKVHGISINKTAFEIPAFPNNEIHPSAPALGYRYRDGRSWYLKTRLKTERADATSHTLSLESAGMTYPRFRFGYYEDLSGPLVPLSGEWSGDSFRFHKPTPKPWYVVVWVTDESLGEPEVMFGCCVVR